MFLHGEFPLSLTTLRNCLCGDRNPAYKESLEPHFPCCLIAMAMLLLSSGFLAFGAAKESGLALVESMEVSFSNMASGANVAEDPLAKAGVRNMSA